MFNKYKIENNNINNIIFIISHAFKQKRKYKVHITEDLNRAM